MFICNRCPNHFSKKDLSDDNAKYYNSKRNTCKVELPSKREKLLNFKNYYYKEKVAFARKAVEF